MSIHRESKLFTYAALFVAGVLLWSGYDSYQILQNKSAAQVDASAELDRYMDSYKALSPVRARWNQLYKDSRQVQDIHGVYKLIDLEGAGLFGMPDRMGLQKNERVAASGVDIGLSKVCPNAVENKGFLISAPSTALLLGGIDQLAKRRDIELQSVHIRQTGGSIEAVLGLCVLVRDGA